MADFKIKTDLDLDTSNAESKISELNNKKVKIKADIDFGSASNNLEKLSNKTIKVGIDTDSKKINDSLKKQTSEIAKALKNNSSQYDDRNKKQKEYTNLLAESKRLSDEEYLNQINNNKELKARKKLLDDYLTVQNKIENVTSKSEKKKYQNEAKNIRKQLDTQLKYFRDNNKFAELNIAESMSRAYNVSFGKNLVKETALVSKEAHKIKKELDSINGDYAKNLLNKSSLKNTHDSMLDLLKKQPIDSGMLGKIQTHNINTRGQLKDLKDIEKIENQISLKKEKVEDSLSGYSHILTQSLGRGYKKELKTLWDSIDTGDFKSAKTGLNSFNSELKNMEKRVTSLNMFENSLNKLSYAESSLKPRQINNFRRAYEDLVRNGEVGTQKFNNQLKKIRTEVSTASKIGTFGRGIKESTINTTMGYLTGYGSRVLIGDTIRYYKDLDSAITNYKKVADAKDIDSPAKIKKIALDSINIAKDVGKSSADVVNSIAVAQQSGANGIKEAMAIGRKSMILANVGDMNENEASKSINTILKSYRMNPLAKVQKNVNGIVKTTDQLSDALDKMNYVGNNYAISSSGVAEAMQNGGAVLHAYGVDYADSVALITAANEPLQDPRKVGNGLKAIAINFAGMSVSAKNGSITLNKTAKALKSIAGIDVYSDKKTGKIKSMTTILTELSGKWNTLREDQKLALSEAVAGKHRANVFQALIGNFDQFKKIKNEFNKNLDFGSAEQENARYINSIEGKLNRLKNTGLQVLTTVLDTDLVYGALDGVNAFAGGLENITKYVSSTDFGTSKMLSLGAGVLGFFKGGYGRKEDFAEDIYTDIPKKNKVNLSTQKESIKKDNKEELRSINAINSGLKEQNKILETNNNHYKNRVKRARDGKRFIGKNIPLISKDNENIPVGMPPIPEDEITPKQSKYKDKITNAISNTKAKMVGVTSAIFDSIKGALIGAGTTFAVSAGLELAYKGYEYLAHNISNTTKKRREEKAALIDEGRELGKNLTYLKTNADEFNRVRRSYYENKNKNKNELTDSQRQDMDKFLQMSKELSKIDPKLTTRYDKNGNPIVSQTANLDTYIKKLEIAKNRQESLLIDKNNSISRNNTLLMTKGEILGGGQISKIAKAKEDIREKYNPLKNSFAPTNIHELSFNNLHSLSGVKDFKEYQKTWQKSYKKTEQELNDLYLKQQNLVQGWDKANAENSEIGFHNLVNNTKFKKFSQYQKEAIGELSQSFQWGKLDGTKTVNELVSIGNKMNPNKIKEYSSEIQKLNDIYKMDKDYEAYSTGIDKISSKLSKFTSLSKKQLSERLKDVDRGYSSVYEEKEASFLKAQGTKISDTIYGNEKKRYRAEYLRDTFRAYENLKEQLMHAESQKERKDALETAKMDTSLPNILQKIAGGLLSTKKEISDNTMASFSSLVGKLQNYDPKNNEFKKNFKKDLLNFIKNKKNVGGTIADIKDALQPLDNTLLSDFANDDFKIEPIKKTVQDFYDNLDKRNKRKTSQDVRNAISNANLTIKEMSSLENGISQNMKNIGDIDNFRTKYAKYFKGVGEDFSKGFKNIALDNNSLKESAYDGVINAMARYSSEAEKVKKITSEMGATLKSNLNDLDGEHWKNYVDNFGLFNKEAKDFLKKAPDFIELGKAKSLNQFSNNLNTLSYDKKKIPDALKYANDYLSEANLDKFNNVLENPKLQNKQLKVKVNAELENTDFLRGVNELLSLPEGKQILLDVIAKGDIDKITGITDRESAETFVKKVKIEYKEDKSVLSDIKKEDKKIITIETVLHNNNVLSDFINSPIKKEVRETPISKKVEAPKSQLVNIGVVDLTATPLNKIKTNINNIPSKKNTVIKSVDSASGIINTVKSGLNGIPRSIVTTLRAAASGFFTLIDKAKAALSGFGGTKTATINLVKKETKVVDVVSGAAPKKSSRGTGIFGAIGNFLFGGRNSVGYTQLNPLATEQPSLSATTTAIADSGSIGGSGNFATPTATTVFGDGSRATDSGQTIEIFKMATFPAYIYKGVTALGRLKYSANEIEQAFKKDVDVLHDFDRAINRVSNSVSILDKRLSRARGSGKIALMELQNHQLREEARRIDAKDKVTIQMRDLYRGKLAKAGVGFKADGTLIDDSLKNVLEWKKKIEEIEKKISDGKGTITKVSKKGKKTTQKVKFSEAEKKKLEDDKKRYEELLKMKDAYEKSVDTIVENHSRKVDIDNKIAENNDEKHRLKISAWTENFEAVNRILDSTVKKITNSLDMLDLKMKYAFGYERLNNMDAQIDKFREMKSQVEVNNSALNNLKDSLKNQLTGYGFTFDGDVMSNYQKQINYLKDTSNIYDDVKSMAEKYFDLVNDRIPENEKKFLEYNNKIKDMMKEKLEDTKTIEDKIVSIYKKEMEKRSDLLDKEVKKREELLRKRREEYQEARKEVDYLDTIAEKQKELHKLKLKYESLKFDTSQKGQMEQQRAKEQIEKLQKDLDNVVTRHIDEGVLKALDDESKRLHDAAEERKEQLKESFSDIELQRMAQESIQTGVFKGIDGQLKSLQSALIEYVDEFEGGLSATGSIIEAEIIAKLNTALDTSKQMSKILSEIGTLDYNSTGAYIQNDKYDSIIAKGKNNNTVNYYAPLLSVNTNSVDNNTVETIMDEMKKLIDKNNRIIVDNTL